MPPNAGEDMEKLYCSYTVMGLGSGRARPQNVVYFKSVTLRRYRGRRIKSSSPASFTKELQGQPWPHEILFQKGKESNK